MNRDVARNEWMVRRLDDDEVMPEYVWTWRQTPPSDVLAELARHPDPVVRRAVAEVATDPELLRELGADQTGFVRREAARNWEMQAVELSRLASDDSAQVRGAVAANPNTLPEVLTGLAVDTVWVREMVAGNESTPMATLVALRRDPEETVRYGVASHPELAPEYLAEFATDPSAMVRSAVAIHPRAAPEALATLADDPSSLVRRMVGMNPRTPADALETLAADPDDFINDSARTTLAAISDA